MACTATVTPVWFGSMDAPEMVCTETTGLVLELTWVLIGMKIVRSSGPGRVKVTVPQTAFRLAGRCPRWSG